MNEMAVRCAVYFLGCYFLLGLLMVGVAQVWVRLPMAKFILAVVTWPRVFFPRKKEKKAESTNKPNVVD